MNFYITKQEVFVSQKGKNAGRRGGGYLWTSLWCNIENFVGYFI